jgi:hypothetical protein
MSTFRLSHLYEGEPLRQFLASCARALCIRLAIIDPTFIPKDEDTPLSGRRQWVLSGMEGLYHMTPNGWWLPKGRVQPTPALWALAERIEACNTIDELLAVESEIKRQAIHVLLDAPEPEINS